MRKPAKSTCAIFGSDEPILAALGELMRAGDRSRERIVVLVPPGTSPARVSALCLLLAPEGTCEMDPTPVAVAGLHAPTLAVHGFGRAARQVIAALSALGHQHAGVYVRRASALGVDPLDLHVVRDSLRRDERVIVVIGGASAQDEVRRVLGRHEAISLDSARERWWLDLVAGLDVHRTLSASPVYRLGFVTALSPVGEGSAYDELEEDLRDHYPQHCDSASFLQGFSDGQRRLHARLPPHFADADAAEAGRGGVTARAPESSAEEPPPAAMAGP